MFDKITCTLLLIVLGGVVLHAPFSVFVSTIWPDSSLLVKSWKEIGILIVAVLLAIAVTRRQQWRQVLRDKLLWVMTAYMAIHLALLAYQPQGVFAAVAGLMIDLRFVAMFVVMYVAAMIYPSFRRYAIKAGAIGAIVVVGWALLQVTVLPHDVLKYIGYGSDTIAPFLTVDNNLDYIRINSTLRGPNPLGAYVVIVLATLLAYMAQMRSRRFWVVLVVCVASFVTLWFSYSRSALLAAAVAIAIVVVVRYGRRLSRGVWIAVFGAIATGVLVLALMWNTSFVQQVVLHEDPNEGNSINSNDGHLESLGDGLRRLSEQPLGAGVGSTGSASLLGDDPVIIENHYLFVAHEVGWVGLAVFIVMQFMVLLRLWRQRNDPLALGVFASGIGMIVIGLLLPVWVDDTVSIIWWGFAGLVIGGAYGTRSSK